VKTNKKLIFLIPVERCTPVLKDADLGSNLQLTFTKIGSLVI
jgi:hypothetical protein